MNDSNCAVDLFAGGGGLSVGLKRGGFKLTAAVEKDPAAVATYKANHPDVQVYRQDIATVKGRDLLSTTPENRIDLLTGCPPCQGFTSLTRKHKGQKTDKRNRLILEMARLVSETRPLAVLVENVPGLNNRDFPFFAAFRKQLDALGYQATWRVLQVADYGVAQYRRRLVLVAGRGFHIPLPEATHSKAGSNGLPAWRTLRDAITDCQDPVPLSEAKRMGGPTAVNWNVTRDMRPITLARLEAVSEGQNRTALPEKLRPECHRSSNSGFTNVYGRMHWDQTPVTITAGCLTASMGRFGHPDKPRTISLREAATIQGFPQNYVFDTEKIVEATQIVGNALPCTFAEVLARQCADAIDRHRERGQDGNTGSPNSEQTSVPAR